jgi:hypothetical protein
VQSPEVAGRLDSSRPLFVAIFGRKGSGKSVLARYLFESFPGDRAVIDPTGDVQAAFPEGYFREVQPGYRGPFPKRDDERRATLILHPKRSSRTYLEDMDHFIKMCLEHGRKTRRPLCLWVDEVGRVATREKTLPHKQEAQEEGRHANLWEIDCGPRPSNIDPLIVLQADIIYAFDLPSPIDRARLAELAGVDPAAFNATMKNLGPYEYVRIDTREHLTSGRRVTVWPALPPPTERATP